MIGTALSLFNDVVTGGSAVANIYKVVSGIIQGDKTEQYLKQVAEHVGDIRAHVERLSDNVLYAADLQAVQDVTQSRQRVVDNMREIRESLEPLSQAIGQEILSSAMIWTPDKMKKAMHKNPWDVLQHICPLRYADSVSYPDMIPVLFEDPDSHVQYIGWQKRGMLLPAFDCEYKDLWVPRKSEGIISSVASKTKLTLSEKKILPVAPEDSEQLALPSIEDIHGWSVNRVQALQRHTAQALSLPLPFRDRLTDISEGPEMVVIPAGKFLMGSPEDEAMRQDNECQHPVIIEQPFAIGRYVVTFEEYDRFCKAESWFGTVETRGRPSDEGWGRGKRPVINVSWDDAIAYTQWLSEQTSQRYRLPTEAEWEYAARAGTVTPFYFGQNITKSQVGYYNGGIFGFRPKTVLVGQFPPNAWGLHDMHGNVWEWTCSVYYVDYDGSEKRCAESGDRDSLRVLRGGGWGSSIGSFRSANRGKYDPTDQDGDLGFRLVRVITT